MTRKEELILDINDLINKTMKISNQIKTIVTMNSYNPNSNNTDFFNEELYHDSLMKLNDLSSTIKSLKALFILYSLYGERSPNTLQERITKDD